MEANVNSKIKYGEAVALARTHYSNGAKLQQIKEALDDAGYVTIHGTSITPSGAHYMATKAKIRKSRTRAATTDSAPTRKSKSTRTNAFIVLLENIVTLPGISDRSRMELIVHLIQAEKSK